MTAVLEKTVGQLVVERPARARVFESFGIDYCCGGRQPLSDACAAKGLDPNMVGKILLAFDSQAAGAGNSAAAPDWGTATLSALADHIESTHHAYLKQELPRLSPIVQKVAGRHGDTDPRLTRLAQVFGAFQAELEAHMRKEDGILFPLCREMEAGNVAAAAQHCGSVSNPIAVMLKEHDDAGDALEEMAALTDNFEPPAHACNTYRALLDALAHLRRDMHQHVHKENNILFPRAIELERRLTV